MEHKKQSPFEFLKNINQEGYEEKLDFLVEEKIKELRADRNYQLRSTLKELEIDVHDFELGVEFCRCTEIRKDAFDGEPEITDLQRKVLNKFEELAYKLADSYIEMGGIHIELGGNNTDATKCFLKAIKNLNTAEAINYLLHSSGDRTQLSYQVNNKAIETKRKMSRLLLENPNSVHNRLEITEKEEALDKAFKERDVEYATLLKKKIDGLDKKTYDKAPLEDREYHESQITFADDFNDKLGAEFYVKYTNRINGLKTAMDDYARNDQFEKAAEVRDHIYAIRQRMLKADKDTSHVEILR